MEWEAYEEMENRLNMLNIAMRGACAALEEHREGEASNGLWLVFCHFREYLEETLTSAPLSEQDS